MSTDTYLSTEEVCGRLSRAGIDTATVSKVFAARLNPENLDDLDRIFVLAVPEPGGRVFLVRYKFGTGAPLPKDPTVTMPQESGPDRRPRWLSVEGPYSVELDEAGKPKADCELFTKAKEFTA